MRAYLLGFWLGLLLFLAWPFFAWSAQYWVNGTLGSDIANSCTAARSDNCAAGGSCARRTINGGIACLASGDTLTVQDGVYDEQISDDPSTYNPGYSGTTPPNGTAGAYTTIRAQNLHGATLRASLNGGTNPFVVILGLSTTRYIRLERFRIDVENKTAGMKECITTWESRDLHFQDIDCKNAELGWSGAGENIVFTRVWMSHIGGGRDGGGACTANNTPFPGMCHGYYAQEGSSRPGPIIIEDGRMWDINGYGVQNYVSTVVRTSRTWDNWQGGIFSNLALTAYSNVVTGNGTYGIQGGGGSTIIGNTVSGLAGVVDPETGPQIGCGIVSGTGSTVQNNLITNIAPAGEPLCPGSGSTVSNNMCDRASSTCTVVSASSTFFVNPGANDFHTHASSPAINAGLTAGSPYNIAMEGVLRPAGQYDIGGYEFAEGPPSGPGVPVAVWFQTYPTSGTVNQPIPPPPVARIVDSDGNTVTTSTAPITIALGSNPGGATLACGPLTCTRNAVAGVVTFSDLTLNVVATGYTLVLASPGLTPDAGSPAFAMIPGPAGAAVSVYFQTYPTSGIVGQPIPPPPQARIVDADGATVTSSTAPITIALQTNPGGATLTCGPLTCTRNAGGGVVTFDNLTLNVAAAGYTLAVSSPGLTPDAGSPAFTMSAPAPSGLTATPRQTGLFWGR